MKRNAPSAERNRDPILAVARAWFPERGLVLEVASGSGQHAAHMSRAFPGLRWQPTDLDPDALASIDAWREEEGLANMLPALRLDTREYPWPVTGADVVVCINMIHISPWSSCEALMRGAGEVLPGRGLLFMYGPYKIDGEHTAPSNEAFDASLRARDPTWGVRDLGEVTDLARRHGMTREALVPMPANNYSLVFRRAEDQGGGT